MRNIVILTFLAFSFLGYAQLTDPFGKIIVHEIKMNKQDDGTYLGAIEWTTGGKDSLQRYIINGLDINAPVMVRIIKKVKGQNIDLSFHKKGWDKVESKISTNGEMFVSKIFRTMNSAGLGVYSDVAGIPYLITVKIGLQFPSTKSLIRLTDNKEEYAQHMRNMGYAGALFDESNTSNNNISSSTNNSSDDSNSLMYIIIGLLAVIAILLIVFLMKRKTSKTITLLILCLGFTQLANSQSSAPRNIPADNLPVVTIGEPIIHENIPADDLAGLEPGTSIIQEPGVTTIIDSGGTTVITYPENWWDGLSDEEIREGLRQMDERDQEFDREYRENMPGEETDGDQRILPSQNAQELAALRRQVELLQQQVDLLSQGDRDFEQGENEEVEIVLYCELLENCRACMDEGLRKFQKHYVYYNYLQNFYTVKMGDLKDAIAYGNSLASVPGAGLGWGPILQHKVRPAVNDLREAYLKKFDEYIESMKSDLEDIRACYTGQGRSAISSQGEYDAQVSGMIRALEASRINL